MIRVIESVFEKLVTWAAAALEKSSNQPVLPHAIIALNASENDISPDLWDTEIATSQLMESLSRTVFQNATFKECAQFWRERNRPIETVAQLLLSYYSSIQASCPDQILSFTVMERALHLTTVNLIVDMFRWCAFQQEVDQN